MDKGSKIINEGVLIQEKIFNRQKCGVCKSPLYIQVYRYDNGLQRIITCKKCKTYHLIKKKKPYMEFPDK
ncbi:MAG: hypothetical protein ACTSRZ_05135 [Promethearchaeota archaeon]